MTRVRIELPEQFHFSTELLVRITDINFGGHLGNDSLMSLLNEARVRFLAEHGFTELDVFGASLIMADSVVTHRSEAFQGENLRVEITAGDFNKYGFDFLYRVTETGSGREVARAKTGMVFFDYKRRQIRPAPPEVVTLFGDHRPVAA